VGGREMKETGERRKKLSSGSVQREYLHFRRNYAPRKGRSREWQLLKSCRRRGGEGEGPSGPRWRGAIRGRKIDKRLTSRLKGKKMDLSVLGMAEKGLEK